MIDHTAALERIEDAERETPFCWCGAPTVPLDRGDVIWLGCSSLQRPKRLVRRLLALDFGHTARPIVDVSQLAPRV
jgi:hypothetical protein